MPRTVDSQRIKSSADGLSASLRFANHRTLSGSVNLASASSPPAFQQTSTMAAFDHTYNLDPTDPNHPILQIEATNLVSVADASGPAVDSLGADGAADLASANILLTDNPRFAAGILGLSVSATFVHSESFASYIFGANHSFFGGAASFGSLTIGGALIGQTLTFAGEAAPNTVLFQSPFVTITLDKQVQSDVLPNASTTPSRMTTYALDIHLDKAHLFGHTISGDITLGATSASLTAPRHA